MVGKGNPEVEDTISDRLLTIEILPPEYLLYYQNS